MADDLELRLNRAAEAATPQAKQIFWKAISDMSVDDARASSTARRIPQPSISRAR